MCIYQAERHTDVYSKKEKKEKRARVGGKVPHTPLPFQTPMKRKQTPQAQALPPNSLLALIKLMTCSLGIIGAAVQLHIYSNVGLVPQTWKLYIQDTSNKEKKP